MKKGFELESGKERKDPAGSQGLARPEEGGRGQRTEKNRGDEITEQSGCVFQAANVRFGLDAQSTHMDRER